MRRYIIYLSMFVAVLIAASCGGSNKRPSNGAPYELLVVADSGVWSRPAGEALRAVLKAEMHGLLQSEPVFSVKYVDPHDYDSIAQLARNVIIVDINATYAETTFKHSKDVYAAPQMILTLQVPDEADLQQFVETNQQIIVDFFTQVEMNRQIALLEKAHNAAISQQANRMFGCDIWLPLELINSKAGENFLWASNNSSLANKSFVMYSYPYTRTDTFTKEYFVHKRDSVMRANIPAYKVGAYMVTDSVRSAVRPILTDADSVMEARGLWRMHGDFMNGPYVAHVQLDPENKRVITTEIFIFSTSKTKRDLVRQMEASLYTLKLPKGKMQGQIPLIIDEKAK